MKIVLSLLVVIIVFILGYSAFQLITFEPKVPAPLVFDDAVDPTMVGSTAIANVSNMPLTPQQQEQSEQAIDKISDVITGMKGMEDQASATVKPTLEILSNAMSAVRLPAYLLSANTDGNGKRTEQELNFDLASVQSADILATDNIVCELNGGNISTTLVGNDNNNSIICASNDAVSANDQLFIGSAGNDTITDSYGNRVVNGGGGNDTIQLGAGRRIVVLDEGWGQDKISFTCAGASVTDAQKPINSPIPWTSNFINFVVLSPKISMSELEWDGMVLKRKGSPDTLTVNDKCFTLITLN